MGKRTDSQFYTVAEAARVLDVSPVTIWRWIEAEKLPAVRVGPRNIRLKKDDVQSMVKPARAKEVTMVRERREIEPATEQELARRQALVDQILVNRKERVISPLTSAELVRKVRRAERRAYDP